MNITNGQFSRLRIEIQSSQHSQAKPLISQAQGIKISGLLSSPGKVTNVFIGFYGRDNIHYYLFELTNFALKIKVLKEKGNADDCGIFKRVLIILYRLYLTQTNSTPTILHHNQPGCPPE